jgi:hypothetical protein
MGYNHKGINFNGGIEEPFPKDLEIPTAIHGYQGYLKKTRGGFFYFFILGYLKTLLICIRMGLVLKYYLIEDTDADKFHSVEPLILMVLIGYTLFNVLMIVKCLLENIKIKK